MRTVTRSPYSLFLLLLLLAPGILSCKSLIRSSFRTPKVRLGDVSLAGNPLRDPMKPWDFILRLEVSNPNAYPLRVAHVAWTATLGHDVISEGEEVREIELPAQSVQEVDIPIAVRPEAFLESLKGAFRERRLSYEFNGSVGIRAPVVGMVRIPFSKAGEYDPLEVLRRKGFGLN